MKNYNAIPSSYRCHRAEHGRVQVLNENSYLMGEYNESTGVVHWRRVVPAAQRATIEAWLIANYPVKAPTKTRSKVRAA